MRKIFIILMFLTAIWNVAAGEIAEFVNLGFSTNSRYFMFAQHGVEETTSKPFVELYTVDVPRNSFVSDGVIKKTYDTRILPGQSSSNAMIAVLEEQITKIKDYSINHLSQGRLVYLLMNGEVPKSKITFRDFQAGRSYSIELIQSTRGEGENVSAAFHIQLHTNSASASKEYVIGIPDYYRAGVMNYRIRQVILSPNEKSLIFVVEKEEHGEYGKKIRYMVETVSIS